MSDQEKMHAFRAKIRHTRTKAAIWFSLTVIFFMAAAVSFLASAIIFTDASFAWLRMLGGEFIAIGLGAVSILTTVSCWKRTKNAENQKEEFERQLHEEVLIPSSFEFCPFCKKPLKR